VVVTTREPLHITDDGEVPFRAPIAGVAPTEASHFVTRGWAEANLGGGGGGGVGGGGLQWAGAWESAPTPGVFVNSYAGAWA